LYIKDKMEQKLEQKTEKQKDEERRIVRILSKDIEGGMNIYAGLTKIKGVSWALSNAVCKILKIDKKRRIGSLSEDEIKKLSDFIRNPTKIPEFILNRRKDFSDGKNKHLVGSDLDLEKEFDIKRLKKIKSYRGLRHSVGRPVRGQRTRSHFRAKKRKAVGVKTKK